MARLGAKGDSKHLRDLMVDVAETAGGLQGRTLKRWSAETHVRAEENAVHVDLHDLDTKLVDQVVGIVLGQASELWTKRIRFITGVDETTLDGEQLTPHLLSALKKWTMSKGTEWKVSNRAGRPYIDLKKAEPDTSADPPTYETGRLKIPRRKSRAAKTPHPFETAQASLIAAEEGRDMQAEIGGFTLAVGLAIPMLAAYYALLDTAVGTLGRVQGGLAGIGLVAVYGGMQFGVLWLVQQLVRPNRINRCKKCGTVNRILPLVRRMKLQCASCEEPLFGAWPIKASDTIKCGACKSSNQVDQEQLVNGIPTCGSCDAPLAGNAKARRG